MFEATLAASGAAATVQLSGCTPLAISGHASRLVAKFATANPSVIFSEAADLLDALTGVLDPGRGTGDPLRAGVARVRQVRGRMPGEWAPLGCVQDLDERLQLALS